MKSIVLNGALFTSKNILHKILKKELLLPDYYGENLDALWDSLTCDIPLPIEIQWINFNKSKKNLGEYADDALNVFIDASEELEGEIIFSYEI